MSEDMPIWEAWVEGGNHLQIWADGRSAGFPDRMVVVNRILPAIRQLEGQMRILPTNPIVSEAAAKANAKHAAWIKRANGG